MEWLNANHIKGEMLDEQFKTRVDEIAATRDITRYGRDGHVQVYEERFVYRNVPYWIRIPRYFQIGIPLDQIRGMNHIGKWAVLEYEKDWKELCSFLNENDIQQILQTYDFLWADTLHTWNDGQTLQQMVEEMHQRAREDIDKLNLQDMKTKLTQHYKEEIAKIEKLFVGKKVKAIR